ncbi:hypothetical protein BDM02DRAFT_888505 [Thelephora ganbajun]|uniref:Uncharacterized protein n=1 Tax=Thelephora ganbajun TaxID=370292 RepID=A0ACB6Z530_THEGA|nr:hypothetical protein BDM02DRAFT_888505 [Thelephora ganbajun]
MLNQSRVFPTLSPTRYPRFVMDQVLKLNQGGCPPTETTAVNDKEVWEVPQNIGELTVSKLLVHPIKSCRGTSLSGVRYTPEGLENDRKWCIITADTHTILTAREIASMVLISPRIEYDETSPYGGKLVVSFPPESECHSFEVALSPTPDVVSQWELVDDCTMFKVVEVDGYICQALHPASSSPSEVLSKYFGRPVHLVMKGPKRRACFQTQTFPNLDASAVYQDGFPLLVASDESLEKVGDEVNRWASGEVDGETIGGIDDLWKTSRVPIERFRPNVVFHGAGVPFVEDMIKELVISSSRDTPENGIPINLVSKCTRCLLPNVDPLAGVRDKAVPYKVLMKFRRGMDPAKPGKACFGCNGVPKGSGVIRVGDFVHVREWAGPGGV